MITGFRAQANILTRTRAVVYVSPLVFSITMKAVVIREQGPPSVLKMEDAPVPGMAVGEVLVKVRACAVNHLDIHSRAGMPGVRLPLILGSDVAGEIAEVGEGVSNLSIGDKVMVSPGLSCGTCLECIDGRENVCRFYHILGAARNGGYAEFVNVPSHNCFPIPKALNFHQAASIPLVFLTAWHMLVTRAQVRPSETVLVVGGGGVVGTAAIQIAKLFHARVIATVGNDDKSRQAKFIGADEVINHTTHDIAEEVKKLTDKRGVDVVFEHVGGAVLEQCLQSLSTNGRLVTCGATIGGTVQVDITRLFMKHQTIYGSITGTKKELFGMMPLFEKGLLKPVVDNVFALSDAREAHEYIEARKHFGKVILDPTK